MSGRAYLPFRFSVRRRRDVLLRRDPTASFLPVPFSIPARAAQALRASAGLLGGVWATGNWYRVAGRRISVVSDAVVLSRAVVPGQRRALIG